MVVRPYLGLGLMMAVMALLIGFNGEGEMGKGSKVWLSEEGEGVEPNRPIEGDD